MFTKKNALFVLPALAACAFQTGVSHAALIDRGGGLIYDDVLNVTWLQDAQYTITTGYNPFGRLSWAEANEWVANLEYVDTVRGVVWDDWRLPGTLDLPSSTGYDTAGVTSELAYMYYVNLGYAPAELDPSAPAPTSSNYNPFINLSYRAYWSNESEYRPGQAWTFHMHFGYQALNGMNDGLRVWAVRDGDVASLLSVPEPGTFALFGLGLVGAGVARRKKAAAQAAGAATA